MAKRKAAVVMTGRYVLCPASTFLHPTQVFVQVLKKERHYARCGCGTNVFMGPGWNDKMGLTYQEAAAVRGAAVT